MNEYEKMFTDNVYELLRTRVYGKVTTYVNHDTLYIKVTNHDYEYDWSKDDFAASLVNGLNSQYIVHDFCKMYSKYVHKRFFRG